MEFRSSYAQLISYQGNGEMGKGKWGNGENGKWGNGGNGEMGNGEMGNLTKTPKP